MRLVKDQTKERNVIPIRRPEGGARVRHFEQELDNLQRSLLGMAALVESGIHSSVTSVTARKEEDARQVIRNEARINGMQIEIDEAATRLLALHQPMAQDLRFLTAAIKINSDLERMGDLAVNIAERAIDMMGRSPVSSPVDIPKMAGLTESMVRRSLNAFVIRDPELARGVLVADDAVDGLKNAYYEELVHFMESDPATVGASVNLLFVVHSLERIADHATNIAEDVLFLAKGIDVRHHAETPK